ncbi:MAG: hypothetical protein HY512_03880 [Candidatus Aenigmarchaeota archaeon]|nr:hypothetical protein [Candidatus Aenigmarchaeota archaeon]
MIDVDYLDQLKLKLNEAEKTFDLSSDLIESTKKCLVRARENLTLHKSILDGCQYVGGADSLEIESVIKTSRVGVRYYSRQIQKIEKDLEEYRKVKNEAENDWKRVNREILKVDIYV